MIEQNETMLWLAVRYHCGELDAGEAASFEMQLADDQATREALSTAVEICEAYRLAEAEIEIESLQPAVAALVKAPTIEPAREQSSRWMRPVGWLSLGAAACLAMLLTWQSVSTLSLGNKGLVANSQASTAVATAWARLVVGEELFLAHVDSEDDDALSHLGQLDGQIGTDADEDDALAPHWLLAAVEAPQLKP